jgi:hypothetical protein
LELPPLFLRRFKLVAEHKSNARDGKLAVDFRLFRRGTMMSRKLFPGGAEHLLNKSNNIQCRQILKWMARLLLDIGRGWFNSKKKF